MGIKDNFSQAVKELWKKDGQSSDNNSDAAKSAPGTTELDKYLKQNPADQGGSAAAQSAPGGGVPLETPYYRTPEQQAAAVQANAAASASAANMANSANMANQGMGSNGAGVSAPQSDGMSAQPYNQNVRNAQNAASQDISRNFGQNNQNAAGAQAGGYERPSDYDQGGQGYDQGYNQGYGGGYAPGNPGNYNANRAGGGFPPSAGGGMAGQNVNETDELTVISKNTAIDGNVRSLANMRIDGNIKGNVETTKNVDMSGKIVGDITCNNAGMNSAAMQGNVSLKGRMRMDRDTILIGDLSSQYADINGRIRGKLDIVGKAELKRDAIVFGDINASTIAVTDGAIIQGYVNTTFLSKEDSRNVFPEAISLDSKENQNNSN